VRRIIILKKLSGFKCQNELETFPDFRVHFQNKHCKQNIIVSASQYSLNASYATLVERDWL